MSGIRFQETVLANGLTVIGEHNPGAMSFAGGYFVNTGARDETPEVAGVSHFLEHMMFKGSDRRSAEDINREFDELGASYNAYTSEERTVYFGAVIPGERRRLLDLLTDMMRPALRQDDFDVEKKVILEEIAMYQDQPEFRAFDLAAPRFFAGHPLGNSILGSVESISELRREDMLAYFERRYAPDNLVVALAGNYDWDDVLAQLEDLTGDWKPAGAGRTYPPFAPVAGTEAVADPKLGRTHLALFAPGVSAQSDLRHAAALLANCLGDASGSRLYWALVDKGLADSAAVRADAADGDGSFVAYASTEPERVDAVHETLQSVLGEVQSAPPSQAEWQAAQNKLATSVVLRGETPYGRLMSLGAGYLHRRAYEPVDVVVENILATTPADAARLLETRPFDRSFTLRLGPDGAGS